MNNFLLNIFSRDIFSVCFFFYFFFLLLLQFSFQIHFGAHFKYILRILQNANKQRSVKLNKLLYFIFLFLDFKCLTLITVATGIHTASQCVYPYPVDYCIIQQLYSITLGKKLFVRTLGTVGRTAKSKEYILIKRKSRKSRVIFSWRGDGNTSDIKDLLASKRSSFVCRCEKRFNLI